MRLSQRCCWRCKSTGKWRYVTRRVLSNATKSLCSCRTLRSHAWCLSVTFQKTWIFVTVTCLNVKIYGPYLSRQTFCHAVMYADETVLLLTNWVKHFWHKHKHTYKYTNTNTHTHIYTLTHKHTHRHIHTHKYTNIYTHIHTHTHKTHTHIYTHTHSHTHKTHTHTYTHSRTYTHARIHTHKTHTYTGCPRRKGPNSGRLFLRSNYTDITQNTYIQSRMVTEIMARDVWNFDSCYSLTDYQIHIETGRNMWFL